MTSRLAKIALLFAIYAGLHLAEACDYCKCPDVLPYIEYAALRVEISGPVADTLNIVVTPDDITFLACNSSNGGLGLIPAAYGCSCGEEGYAGPKFPLTHINITADKAFNDTLPPGASLNNLFSLSSADYPAMRYQLDEVAQLNHWDYGFYIGYGGALLTCTDAPASTGVPFLFNITFTKSNGQTVSVTTPAIIW